MSTRCTLTVFDSEQAFTVYRQSDGYPDTEHGVLAGLRGALSYAWPLPRFEPDEFAAAIVAAWKKPAQSHTAFESTYTSQGGNIRLINGNRDSVGDSAFHYDITQDKRALRVTVFKSIERNGDSRSWKRVKSILLRAKDQPTPPIGQHEEAES
jgi:hypothetical protein